MDDLLNEFLEETNESLEKLDQDFIELEQNPEDTEIVKNIFRVMHTIKGTSGFLSFSRLESIAHAAENLMDKVRGGELAVSDELITLVLKASDDIKEIVEDIEEAGEESPGDDSQIISELNSYAENGQAAESPAGATKEEEKPEIEEKVEEISATGSKTPDLDEEIDFEPIAADFVSDEDRADIDGQQIASALEGEEHEQQQEVGSSKTPDLDEEIDFEPIAADFVSDEDKADIDGQQIASALEGKDEAEKEKTLPKAKDIPVDKKRQAVEAGLKATEEKNLAKKPVKPTQNIKVSLDVLENLMQLVGELVLSRNQLLQLRRNTAQQLDSNFSTSLQRLNIITTELQEGVMKTRMNPISGAWSKFPRVIRDLSKDLNKKIRLEMRGEETELDRQMLEAIRDPLTHMIRNSCDHGIESPEERLEKGKPEEGTVTLDAYHEGGHIIIKVSDDGKGIDVNAVKKKAIENGLATEAEVESMTEKQICQFILKAGFSTAEAVTSISGRGVGMDVVVSSIQKIGGSLEVESEFGKGSEFLIKLPLTLAIMPVMIVQSAEETFAIPQIMVSEIVKVQTDNSLKQSGNIRRASNLKLHKTEIINGAPVLRLRGKLLSLISLSEVLGIDRSEDDAGGEQNFVVVCEIGSSSFGIMVDKVFHTEEIVVKPKTKLIKDLDVYSGSTILGDGRVILIIDPNGILKQSNIKSISNEVEKLEDQNVFDEEEINFLMFTTEDGLPKAIPLELVSRLEEIDYSKVETSGGAKVVQYRDGLMRVISIDDSAVIPEEGIYDTIVFTDRNRILGVYAKQVIDIVKDKLDIKSVSSKEGVLGSMVMNGKTTEIVDISYYISKEFSDWLGHGEAGKVENEVASKNSDSRKHVLLVDDSSFFRKFMRPVILASGYRVSTCEDGLEGLNMLKEHGDSFDIVISDIDMPNMNGVEFVKEAKKDPNISHIPFIALTSHEEDDFDEDLSVMGFESLVTKANRNRVVELITEILEEKKMVV